MIANLLEGEPLRQQMCSTGVTKRMRSVPLHGRVQRAYVLRRSSKGNFVSGAGWAPQPSERLLDTKTEGALL